MAKYNKPKKEVTVTNYEGNKAYQLKHEMELYSLVCNCMCEDQYYRKNKETLNQLKELVQKCDNQFIMKLSIYAREQMNLRSIPLVLAILLVKKLTPHTSKSLEKQFIKRIIQRADELTEICGIYKEFNEQKLKPIPNWLKEGIALAFENFDEYQFAKYKKSKSDITLKYIARNLVHPHPKNDEQKLLYGKIMEYNNTKLDVPYTWEVELSNAKKNNKSKQQVWEDLIDSKKLPYMALLRNLRNILQENVSINHITKICNMLSNAESVKKSKQFPFRFLSAYREIQEIDNIHTSDIMTALENAIEHTVDTLKINGNIFISIDTSGSMTACISEKSKIRRMDIGIVLAMLLKHKTKCITSIFAEGFKIKNFYKNAILTNCCSIQDGEVGHSTNGYLVLKYAIDNDLMVDKIMIFTDLQLWNDNIYAMAASGNGEFKDLWKQYKKINKKCKLYLFDLAGYGNVPVKVNEDDVYMIAGWSDRIFDMLHALENGNSILKEIDKIEIVKNENVL
jgi:60 kDa SS-A/Ro ribonucleoprotein